MIDEVVQSHGLSNYFIVGCKGWSLGSVAV
jgi:hypothetical protein